MSTFEKSELDEVAAQDAAVSFAASDIEVVPDHEQSPPTPRRAWWDLDRQGSLSRIQKILLATDGTVTRVLEACAGEEMQLTKLEQTVVPAATADADLALSQGEDVMSRTVLLRGSESGHTYVYAESLIIPGRLHPRLVQLRRTDRVAALGEPSGDRQRAHEVGAGARRDLRFTLRDRSPRRPRLQDLPHHLPASAHHVDHGEVPG